MKRFLTTIFILLIMSMSRVYGSEKGMPQLNPEFWPAQIFWLIIIFSALYIILWKVFLPKIANNIESRKVKVVSDLNETEKLKENAEKKLKEYNEIIENAKQEAKKLIDDGKIKLSNDIDEKNKTFSKEIENELLDVEKEIKNLKNSSVLNINKIATEISSNVLKQIIGAEVNTSSVTEIVKDVSKREMGKHL